MRGHITKRSKNSWTVIFDEERDPATGRRKQRWVSVKGTKRDAEARLAEILHQMETGVFLKPTRLTVADFLRQWLQDYAATNVRASTQEGYAKVIEGHLVPGLGAFSLAQLQPKHLQAYYAQKLANGRRDNSGGLSPSSVRGHHRILSEALSHAAKWGLVVRNVAQAVDPPQPERSDMQALDAEGVGRLLFAAEKTPYYALFHLAIHTGLRRSELLGLRWRDLDLDLLTLSVVQTIQKLNGGRVVIQGPKTSRSRRRVDLTPSSAQVLREHRNRQAALGTFVGAPVSGESLVFTHSNGSPLTPNVVSHAFRKLVRRLGFEGVRLHDMRHTHATIMLAQGIHPKIVSERLGHSSVSITLDTYSHVLPGLQERSARRFDEELSSKAPEKVREAASETVG